MCRPYYADSMAFLAPQGREPIFNLGKRPQLDLAHLTSVPSIAEMRDFETALGAHQTFRDRAWSNQRTHEVLFKEYLDRSDSMGLVFGIQQPLDNLTLTGVQALAAEGIRFMGIAYDAASEYGGGFLSKGGLTRKGCDLIGWMGECGIVLDLSHVNHQTAHEVLYFIRQEKLPVKVAVTHTSSYQEFKHPRNIDVLTLCGIAKQEGYVGIFLTSFFLCEEGYDSLFEAVHHLIRTMKVMGADKVGVGSNCPHVNMSTKEADENFRRMRMIGTGGRLGEYFPDRAPAIIELGSEMFPVIRQALLAQGLTTIAADSLCGDNFRNFLRRSLPSRA